MKTTKQLFVTAILAGAAIVSAPATASAAPAQLPYPPLGGVIAGPLTGLSPATSAPLLNLQGGKIADLDSTKFAYMHRRNVKYVLMNYFKNPDLGGAAPGNEGALWGPPA